VSSLDLVVCQGMHDLKDYFAFKLGGR
jgi:hypothetical protein